MLTKNKIVSSPMQNLAAAPATMEPKRGRMIWGLSLHGWEDLMRISLAVVGVFGLLVGLSTFFVVTLQREEITASKEAFEKYKIAAAKEVLEAGRVASEARDRAAKSELALEKFRAPRAISTQDALQITAALKEFEGAAVVFGVFQDPEAIALLEQISKILISAGWVEQEWKSGGDIVLTRGGVHPPAGFVNVIGLYVQADIAHGAAFGPIVHKLAKLLSDAGVEAKPEIGRMAPNTNNDAIKILIGQKPR